MRVFACFLLGLLPLLAQKSVFTHITGQAGITWTHFNGQSPEHFLVETTTGGVAFLDFDSDGLLDLFLVNGGETPNGKRDAPIHHALYRNLGDDKFENVADKAGIAKTSFYGMGAAASDFDNDGFTDIYVTGYPSSALFRNKGDGSFEDVTAAAGVGNQGEWASSSVWFDHDRDGLLDLFVCNYVTFSFDDERICDFAGERTYCAQTEYEGRRSRLYRNAGDGTFRDISRESGVAAHQGRALGAVAIDANDDGWDDLFVARDASPNLLLINKRNGTFEDLALEAETAYSPDGVARAGMGVDAGDLDGDGRPDFVVTNFDHEYHALYLNQGQLPYREVTMQSGLARFTNLYVGWGVRLIDYDNDGDLDLLIVNGHLHEQIELSNRLVKYREPPLLLANQGHAVFEDVSDRAGQAFQQARLGRGLATGDFDNDGCMDAAFVSLNEGPVLLRNECSGSNHWLGVQLLGTKDNRDAIGSKLILTLEDRRLVRWVQGGGSFQSSHDLRIVFGLGSETRAQQLEIRWPNGERQIVTQLSVNRYNRISQPAPAGAFGTKEE